MTMAWYHEVRSALASMLRRGHDDRELDEELRFHLEKEIEQKEDGRYIIFYTFDDEEKD